MSDVFIKNLYSQLLGIKSDLMSFNAKDDTVYFNIFCKENLDVLMSFCIPAQVVNNINFCCSLNVFLRYVKACTFEKDSIIGIKIHTDSSVIISDNNNITRMVLPLYPSYNIPDVNYLDTKSIPISKIEITVLEDIFKYVNVHDRQSEQHGVFFSFEKNQLTVSSTDGYRIAFASFNILESDINNFFIHDTDLLLLKSFIALVKKNPSLISISIDNNRCIFNIDNNFFSSPISNGAIFDFIKSIPLQENASYVILDRVSFLLVGKKFIDMLTEDFVILNIIDNTCIMQSQDGSDCKLDISDASGDFVFKINAKHFLTAVQNLIDPFFNITVFNNAILIQETRKNMSLTYLISLFDF